MSEEEPSVKAATLGAAALGAVLDVGLLGGDLPSAAIAALLFAYISTLSNGLGDATKSAGSFAAKAYDKTLELNGQYEILPKAKNAVDTVTTVADNVNQNYGLTQKLDEKLQLSPKLEKLTDKIDDIKDKVTSKTEELKAAASPRGGDVKMSMEEPDDKAIAIGAAALGATLDVGLLEGDLPSAALAALLFAYASTLSNGLGDATKSAGSLAAKAYGKTVEVNEQYEILPKAKSAADTITTVAGNLNANYGLTEKLDEKLNISPKLEKLTDKIEDVKGKVTSKIDEVKDAASGK